MLVSVSTATRGVADVPVGGAGRMIANPTSVVFTNYLPGHSYTVSSCTIILLHEMTLVHHRVVSS